MLQGGKGGRGEGRGGSFTRVSTVFSLSLSGRGCCPGSFLLLNVLISSLSFGGVVVVTCIDLLYWILFVDYVITSGIFGVTSFLQGDRILSGIPAPGGGGVSRFAVGSVNRIS